MRHNMGIEPFESLSDTPRAECAHYDKSTHDIVLNLGTGASLHIPVMLIQGISTADPCDLQEVLVDNNGLNLNFQRLGVDFYVPSLILGVYGTFDWMMSLSRTVPHVPEARYT